MAQVLAEPSIDEVLNSMRGVPLREKMGVIDDVRIKTLQRRADARGYFIEQLKRGDLDDRGRPLLEDGHVFAQMSRSLAFARGGNPPELIKAFHWHRRQWDYWDIVHGSVRVVLVDARPSSPTAGRIQVIPVGEYAPVLVGIPPFVLHGYQCLSMTDVMLTYYVTTPYDVNDPDEGRVAWNDERIGFDWKVENI